MFISNRSAVSLCDRLKQRYENDQQNWQSLFQNGIQEKNTRDWEFIRYIVNFIIEQAKHNIVLSELPDVIRTLHYEAEAIIRKDRMITLQEVIAQVQIVGAMKYPYLRKVKPVSTEDFVKEVIREVFDRLGTIITLDMIENICRFTTCSAKQLLYAMPAIDVNEAATLITEDISRNQRKINKNQKQAEILKSTIKEKTGSHSTSSMNRQAYRNQEDTSASSNKQRIRSERESSRLTQNSKKSYSRTKLSVHKDLPIIKKKDKSSKNSSKNSNKNQQSRSSDEIDLTEKRSLKLRKLNSQFTQTIMKKPKPTNVFSSTFVPFDDTWSTREYQQIETEQNLLSTRESVMKHSVHEQTKNQREEIINPLTANLFPILNSNLINQEKNRKIKLSRSNSNTQTYSIHSEEGLSIRTRKSTTNLILNMNDNTIIKPIISLNKICQKPVQQILSHTAPFINTVPFSNEVVYSNDRPFIIETMSSSNLKETKSYSEIPQSIQHHRKYCYQHLDISDNEDQTSEIDSENCPLEDILNRRLVQVMQSI